jgi:hypothetical protein
MKHEMQQASLPVIQGPFQQLSYSFSDPEHGTLFGFLERILHPNPQLAVQVLQSDHVDQQP